MKKIFNIQKWSPEIVATANNLIADIHRAAPSLEILFMGAAALGLPGKNDIDLDILCNKEEVEHYRNILSEVLGEPKELKNDMVFWEFEYNGYEIDCVLSDPNFSHVPVQRRRFEILKQNPKLLDKYKELKISCDGLEYDEYEKRKKSFFNDVLDG
jgi:GrpB-like predicted nucleotidyltransferase (UPF0157 family)